MLVRLSFEVMKDAREQAVKELKEKFDINVSLSWSNTLEILETESGKNDGKLEIEEV